MNTYHTTQWLTGINLLTFKMLHGVYPSNERIKKSLKKLKNVVHNDWTINNMIIQGNKISLIDNDDPTHCSRGPGGGRRY